MHFRSKATYSLNMTLIQNLIAIQLKSLCFLSDPGKVFSINMLYLFFQAQSQCKGSALFCLNALLKFFIPLYCF